MYTKTWLVSPQKRKVNCETMSRYWKSCKFCYFIISRNLGKNEGFLHSNIFKKKAEKILLPEFGNVPRKVHLENWISALWTLHNASPCTRVRHTYKYMYSNFSLVKHSFCKSHSLRNTTTVQYLYLMLNPPNQQFCEQ